MTHKRHAMSLLLIALGLLVGTCSQAPHTRGGAAAGGASAADAEKTLIPHKSWTCGMPEGIPKPESGTLAFEADIKLDQIYDVGKTPFGQRHVFVTQSGTVTGPKITATVLAGGLDFQLTLSNGVVETEQVFMLRTADGKFIYMRNAGTGPSAADQRVVLDVEAPNNSTTAWLNTGKYVGRRVVDVAAKTMKLKVYEVTTAATQPDSQRAFTISKPADLPAQPWDYRARAATEKNGEEIVVENVALGPSQSVGASKNGNRNVIPITGGTLTGTIPGKVLPGGADYQNLTKAPTIDARYLWQTPNGEIILVRNTGGFGGLVPIFEAKVDGQYAWLNSGKYLSSSPGMGAGGVKLTFYKSKTD